MVPLTGPIPADQAADIRHALKLHIQRAGLTQSDVADALGTSGTYVNNLLVDPDKIPTATRDRMLRDVNNWLERESRAAEAQRDPGFVRTRVAERMIALAEQLTERADMAIAVAPAGVGKSTCIEAIVAEVQTAIAMTAGDDTNTPCKLVKEIFRLLARRGRSRSVAPTVGAVAELLRMPDRVQTRNVLIIDEAHELPTRCWKTLMQIHDRAQCSIMLVGTRDLFDTAKTDDKVHYGQLSSRVGIRIDLAPELCGRNLGGKGQPVLGGKLFTAAEVRKLVNRSRLKFHPKALAMLVRIANEQRGTLRRVGRLTHWAIKGAQQDGLEFVELRHVEVANEVVEKEFALPREDAATVAEAEAAIG